MSWAEQGVPLKVAYQGIDRYFERYYRKGPRRRPVKIDFCEADVLDVFDEWRRATGVVSRSGSESGALSESPGTHPELRRASLPAHLSRVVLRLTAARAGGTLGADFDTVIDRLAAELDTARAKAGGLRGDARQALVDRLMTIDRELLQQARAALEEVVLSSLSREAEDELSGFRTGMTADAFARAREAAIDRLVRARLHLPIVAFEAA